MRRVFPLIRPFGIALAIFIFLNLALALRRPALSATSVWLYLHIREPLLSAISGFLGIALLLPHGIAARPALRLFAGGTIAAFLVLVITNILNFYITLYRGILGSALPVPFSALIALILASEGARVIWWKPVEARFPLPARRFFQGLGVAFAFFTLILSHIITFGFTDYAPAAEAADAAVVLGAKVYPDLRLSAALEDRMWTGIRLLQEKRVKYLILSGGIEAGGLSEPRAMEEYALASGVPKSAIILDENGANTWCSARSCGEIAAKNRFSKKLLVVSQYFHNARVKMIFEREGTRCYTVPARYRPLARETFFVLREAVAFPVYYLWYL